MNKIERFITTQEFTGLRKTKRGHEVIGKPIRHYLDKEGPKKHLTVAILIKDKKGRYLLQKRSKTVMTPNKLDFSVGGHVDYGLTVEGAARKEAKEELGIKLRNLRWLAGPIMLKNPRHMTVLFSATRIGKIKPDRHEINPIGTRYYALDEIHGLIRAGKLTSSLAYYLERFRGIK